ncbi:DUF2628 domain-containing protein [Methylocapsa sp. S129]|uniref:DUF2628 domain-containing protein n=1 Tax=Methylocapsa sp. S129 TaxID=1641869 RepID=UPI00131D10A7|nr:DUF2628 domain-containing protein [Methylocapsa sp. S129]
MSFLSPASGEPPDPKFENDERAEVGPAGPAELANAPAPVDEALSRATAREADLRLFAGANADVFVKMSKARETGSAGGNAVCWPGFLFPAAWFLYRKMYGYAAITILLPVLASLVHVPGEITRWIGFGFAFLGAFGNRLYLARARKMIAEIRAAATDEANARETIARAGGVSVAGAVIGALLIAAFVAFALLKV